MKQDFMTKKTPLVIQEIRKAFGDNPPADFKLLDKNDKEEARNNILKNVFGHARKKTSLVVPRFQKIPGDDGNVVDYEIFYSYDDDKQLIRLRHEALDFFQRNNAMLYKMVIAEWAKFLERINGALPYIVSKVEAPTKERNSLVKYYKMWHEFTSRCFYCEERLEKKNTQVDHLIPWSYIFDDNPWNLVLACKSCNCEKSNYLPRKKFKDDLIDRNERHVGEIKELRTSLDMLDVGKGWKNEINRHYETCKLYGFGAWNPNCLK